MKKDQTPTISSKDISEKWYIVDASNFKLGRLATVVASVLLGKNDPKLALSTNLLPQNKVIVINAAQVGVTGSKREQKVYTNYSGYPGGLRERLMGEVLVQNPIEVITRAVTGMLPKNRRGKAIAAHLFVYSGSDYKQVAQQPQPIN